KLLPLPRPNGRSPSQLTWFEEFREQELMMQVALEYSGQTLGAKAPRLRSQPMSHQACFDGEFSWHTAPAKYVELKPASDAVLKKQDEHLQERNHLMNQHDGMFSQVQAGCPVKGPFANTAGSVSCSIRDESLEDDFVLVNQFLQVMAVPITKETHATPEAVDKSYTAGPIDPAPQQDTT
ncbi:hypothetical protein L0F63_002610, partial [Massospora cicadina]